MDRSKIIKKLKIEKFGRIKLLNFPPEIKFDLDSVTSNPQCVIYFIGQANDVEKLMNLCPKLKLPAENRVIMIFKKGHKDVNRDNIIGPFRAGNYPDFKFRAPMLCALSNELSAFVFSYEGGG